MFCDPAPMDETSTSTTNSPNHTHSECETPAVTQVSVVEVRTSRRTMLGAVEWLGRILLLAVVLWGGWQTATGVNRLFQIKSRLTSEDVSFEPPQMLPTLAAINAWTVPGTWEFFDQSEDVATGPLRPNEHLVTWPSDAQPVAFRRDAKGRILVQLFTTGWPVDSLTASWERPDGSIELVRTSTPTDQFTCEIRGDSGTFLVWSTASDHDPLRTIVCTRCDLIDQSQAHP